MKKLISLLFCVAFLALTITACGTGQTPTEAPPTAAPTSLPPTEPPPTEVPTEAPPPTEPPALEPLPPEPREIEFQAVDDQALLGEYYPAAVDPAPVVVLMHWAPGDQRDWVEIAYWLQNRGLGGQSDKTTCSPSTVRADCPSAI